MGMSSMTSWLINYWLQSFMGCLMENWVISDWTLAVCSLVTDQWAPTVLPRGGHMTASRVSVAEMHHSRVVPQCLPFEHASVGLSNLDTPMVLFTFPNDYTVNVLLGSVHLSAIADSPLATFGVDESSAVRKGATKCLLAEPSTIYLPPPQWQPPRTTGSLGQSVSASLHWPTAWWHIPCRLHWWWHGARNLARALYDPSLVVSWHRSSLQAKVAYLGNLMDEP